MPQISRYHRTLAGLSLILAAAAPWPAAAQDSRSSDYSTYRHSQAMPIDGIWQVRNDDKRIAIENGRAVAVEGWMHMFVIPIMAGSTVIKDLREDSPGTFTGYDNVLLGRTTMQLVGPRTLEARIASLIPITLYFELVDAADPDALEDAWQREGDSYQPDDPYEPDVPDDPDIPQAPSPGDGPWID